MSAPPIVIAHLSDAHLDARPVTLQRLKQVIAAVRQLPRIDAVVVTGDIADGGLAPEYQGFMAEIPGLSPTIVTTGNEPERLSADGSAPPGFAVHTIDRGRLASRFVALGSS